MRVLDDIPTEIVAACQNRGMSEDQIRRAAPRKLFTEFCEWHGLVQWGPTLWRLVDELIAMDQAKVPARRE